MLVIVMSVDYCYCPTGYFIRLASGLFWTLGTVFAVLPQQCYVYVHFKGQACSNVKYWKSAVHTSDHCYKGQ